MPRNIAIKLKTAIEMPKTLRGMWRRFCVFKNSAEKRLAALEKVESLGARLHRKPASVFEATRDRPETFDELVTEHVDSKREIYRLIREVVARQDTQEMRQDRLENDYKHTNKRMDGLSGEEA